MATMRLSPGRWLNAQMHLLSWLGEELHGESFLAEQRPQGRSVVVKVLYSDACRTANYIERFRHAAERAMLLSHKNVAAVHAFGVLSASAHGESSGFLDGLPPPSYTPSYFSDGSVQSGAGIPWIAVDPVEGPDLRSYLAEGVTAETLAPLLVPVADVLDRAASLGLTHGEVSPANLLIVSEPPAAPRIVLIDMGVAKVLASDLLELPSTPGALAYRSPEQCVEGTHVEPASDRYALAAILYELVAGRPPFFDANPRTLMQLHRCAPVPPLRTRAPHLRSAEALDAFFVRALAKQPEPRFQSAMAMMEEFLVALGLPRPGRPAQTRRSPRRYRLYREGALESCIEVVVGPRAVLGKQSECDVVCQALPSPDHDLLTGTISREHAVLIWLDNRLSVLDQSSNGTHIDGKRVGPRLTPLPDGATLRLGEHLAVQVSLLAGVGPTGEVPGAYLSRRDRYAAGVAPTLMLWQNLPLRGSPLERLGGGLRFGQVWVAQRELWWSGHPAVVWQRQDGSTVLGPAPLRNGDSLTDSDGVLRVEH